MTAKVVQLVLAVLLVTAALTAEARFAVKMVQLVHRHGHRAPLATDNASEVCGTEYPCGDLTNYGIEMLNSIGRYVRARYNDLSIVEEPLFSSTRYNSSIVYTRSTGAQRTIQSATAFLKGLFPDDYFYPVVYSVNHTLDTLLNTDPMPSVIGRRWMDMDAQNTALNAVVDAHLTWDQIQAAAKEAFIAGSCQNYAQRASCVSTLYDIATSFEVSGRLSSTPNLEAAFPALAEYTKAWYRFVFDYNKSIELESIQGAPAQNIAQMLMANINAHRLSPSYKLYEYSTHDSLVAPLGITFGDHSDATMLPPYAITIIVELLQDTESPNDWYVRLLRGHPVVLDNGSYEFRLDGIQVNCLDAAGNHYVASTSICPLDTLRRFVDYSRPSVPNGQCTMSDTQFTNLDCPASIADNKAVPHYCWVYRYVCPQSACATGYVLLAANQQCYPTGDVTTTSGPAQLVTPPVPAKWTPRVLSEKVARKVALGLVQGVSDGVVVGSAVKKQQK